MADFGKRLYQAMRLYEARLKCNLSNEELAQCLPGGARGARAASTISRWLRGENEPRLATLARLAAFLEVDPGWLAFGEETTALPPSGSNGPENGGRTADDVRDLAAEADRRQPPPGPTPKVQEGA